MNEKMSFGEIRRDIIDNQNTKEIEKNKEAAWSVYDSSIDSFGRTFLDTLPVSYSKELHDKENISHDEYGEPFRKYIVDTLEKTPGKHTAIEFGGPGSVLFSAFSNEFLNKTVGVCLKDIRHKYEKERDDMYGHSVIEGDFINTNNTDVYEKIKTQLASQKTDLIVSRMMGPLANIAKNPLILDRVIQKWYNMLNENGIIFAQFDYFPGRIFYKQKKDAQEQNRAFKSEVLTDIESWVHEINKRFPNEIEIQLSDEGMRLHKKIGAPEQLPTMKELF